MTMRSSGVLLHVTSLCNRFGIGDLGPEAFRFADLLAENGQSLWQVLPLNPTDPSHGNSPYHSVSAFAGNPLAISPELLEKDGWASEEEIADGLVGESGGRVDFDAVIKYKDRLFDAAYDRFENKGGQSFEFDRFCGEAAGWLDDYALFRVLRRQYPGMSWRQWPSPLRNREPGALSEVVEKSFRQVGKEKFLQFLFFDQWKKLKRHCNGRGVRIFGDIPIYMPLESVEVWSRPAMFKLDGQGSPLGVSGVPPDYFSSTGQLWGHPVYDWDRDRHGLFSWWSRRIAHNLDIFDVVRLDHFRGLVGFWEVPPGEETAEKGKWVDAPGGDLITFLQERMGRLPLVAEDLGTITDDVKEVIRRFDLPGMRVLQFGFGGDFPRSTHLPHLHEKNCVVYTGSHDNNTALGWYENDIDDSIRNNVGQYTGRSLDGMEIHWELIRMALMSVADTAVVPLQDLIGLGAEARMNTPGEAEGNWEWRLTSGQLTPEILERFRALTLTYGR